MNLFRKVRIENIVIFVLSEENKICDFINYEIFRSVHESYLNCFVLKLTKR